MTKAELLSYTRLRLDDSSTPYLWSDAELTDYLEDAEAEAAERARLIKVSGVSTYCDITLVASTASYGLNSLVFDVETARVSGEEYNLKRTSRDVLDARNPAWSDDSGVPEEYFVEEGSITFYPNPSDSGTVNMVVYRLPLATMGTSPEIHARHHMRLLDWTMHLAYLKRDVNAYDLQRAEYHEKRFERSFGKKWDATQQMRMLRKKPRAMRDDQYFGEQ